VIKWLIAKLRGRNVNVLGNVTLADVEALQKALSCDPLSDDPLRRGSVLQIEELPGWMFNGEPEVVMRKSDGQVFDVCVSSYNKELHGEEVTIKENGEYITLLPGEFTVVTSHYEPMP